MNFTKASKWSNAHANMCTIDAHETHPCRHKHENMNASKQAPATNALSGVGLTSCLQTV